MACQQWQPPHALPPVAATTTRSPLPGSHQVKGAAQPSSSGLASARSHPEICGSSSSSGGTDGVKRGLQKRALRRHAVSRAALHFPSACHGRCHKPHAVKLAGPAPPPSEPPTSGTAVATNWCCSTDLGHFDLKLIVAHDALRDGGLALPTLLGHCRRHREGCRRGERRHSTGRASRGTPAPPWQHATRTCPCP